MPSINHLPNELLMDIVERMETFEDLHALLNTSAKIAAAFASAGEKKQRQILSKVLPDVIDPFGIDMGLKHQRMVTITKTKGCAPVNKIIDMGKLEINTSIHADVDVQLARLEVKHLKHLFKLCSKYKALVDWNLENLPQHGVEREEWLRPWGPTMEEIWKQDYPFRQRPDIHSRPWKGTRKDILAMQRPLYSGFFCFEMFLHQRGLATTVPPRRSTWTRLFGIKEPWVNQGPKELVQKMCLDDKRFHRLTGISLVTWFFKTVVQASVDNGNKLPNSMKHLPGLLRKIVPDALQAYSKKDRMTIMKSFKSEEGAENMFVWTAMMWQMEHSVFTDVCKGYLRKRPFVSAPTKGRNEARQDSEQAETAQPEAEVAEVEPPQKDIVL